MKHSVHYAIQRTPDSLMKDITQSAIPFILLAALAYVAYGISSTNGDNVAFDVSMFVTLLLAFFVPDYLLKLLERRGLLNTEICNSKVIRALASALFVAVILLPIKGLLSPMSTVLSAGVSKHLMMYANIVLAALVSLHLVVRTLWHPDSKKYVHLVEERDLIQRLKAQGCSSQEILERIDPLRQKRMMNGAQASGL